MYVGYIVEKNLEHGAHHQPQVTPINILLYFFVYPQHNVTYYTDMCVC